MDGMGLVRKKHVPRLKFNMLHLKMAPIGIGDSRLGNHHALISFRFRVQLGEGCQEFHKNKIQPWLCDDVAQRISKMQSIKTIICICKMDCNFHKITSSETGVIIGIYQLLPLSSKFKSKHPKTVRSLRYNISQSTPTVSSDLYIESDERW